MSDFDILASQKIKLQTALRKIDRMLYGGTLDDNLKKKIEEEINNVRDLLR